MERGSLGGHGGARSNNYAVRLLSAHFDWKHGRDVIRVPRDSNVGLFLGAMGEDISSFGSGSLGDAYDVSGRDQEGQGRRRNSLP